MYKLACLCALLTLLRFSVGEIEDCDKVRCPGPVGLPGSKEQAQERWMRALPGGGAE